MSQYFWHPTDRRLNRYDHFICHCTATTPDLDVDDKWVDSVHRQRGFQQGAGYHVLIGRDGKVYTHDLGHNMRPFNTHGAHVGSTGPGWNSRSFGVALAGGIDRNGNPDNNFTVDQWRSLKTVCIQFLMAHPRHDVTFLGHRDLVEKHGGRPKSCPCFDFPAWVNQCDIKSLGGSVDREDLNHQRTRVDLPVSYSVKEGDSLWKISESLGVEISYLRQLNPDIRNSTRIYPGQTLKVRL